MTSRLFIIRGTFIIFWFFYDFMSSLLINQKAQLQIDFLLIFGAVSLGLGLWLKLSGENKIKREIALIMALIGLAIGLKGIQTSWLAFNRVLESEAYFSLKATSSLFFGLLIVGLYLTALKELFRKFLDDCDG